MVSDDTISFFNQGSFGLSNESVKKSSLGIFPVLPFSFDIVSKEGLRVGQASGKVQITMPSNLSEESSNSILLRGYLLKRGGRIQRFFVFFCFFFVFFLFLFDLFLFDLFCFLFDLI